MARNEMTVLTMESIKALTNEDLRRELMNYATAGNEISNARWLMAESVYNVMNEELFDEDFETEQEFYNFINIKKSNGSQLVNAVRFMKRESLDYGVYTVGKAYALSTLEQVEFNEFMDYCNSNDICTHSMTDKALIELIKEWKKSQLNVVEEHEVEEQEVEEIDDRISIINQIKEMMEKYNITIEELQ